MFEIITVALPSQTLTFGRKIERCNLFVGPLPGIVIRKSNVFSNYVSILRFALFRSETEV